MYTGFDFKIQVVITLCILGRRMKGHHINFLGCSQGIGYECAGNSDGFAHSAVDAVIRIRPDAVVDHHARLLLLLIGFTEMFCTWYVAVLPTI